MTVTFLSLCSAVELSSFCGGVQLSLPVCPLSLLPPCLQLEDLFISPSHTSRKELVVLFTEDFEVLLTNFAFKIQAPGLRHPHPSLL